MTEQSVDHTPEHARATDEHLAAACVLGSFDGTEAPEWLLRRISDGLGGVVLFAQNIVDDDQLRRLCSDLHAARADVIVAIDEEGGDVTRLDAADGSDTPCPAAFAAVNDVDLTRRAFRDLGDRLRDVGVDLTLAPCADINSNPANPIIGVRAFGATADLAARHASACVDGFRGSGTRTCVKHFPGHGDTRADTHLGAARVEASLAMMRERELLPFAAAIAAGAEAVLTAHIIAACVDEQPASLSAAWTRVLRDELGFEGVIITDALDMGAVSGGRGVAGVADGAVTALAAGADFLCLGSNFDAESTDLVVTTVREAITSGVLDRTALADSAHRIAGLRATSRVADASTGGDRGSSAREVAQRAIEVHGDLHGQPALVIECRPQPNMACSNVEWGLARHLIEHGWPAHALGPAADLNRGDLNRGDLNRGDLNLDDMNVDDKPMIVVVRDADVHPWQQLVVERCIAMRPDTVVVELGWPSLQPTPAAAHIITHGAARSSTRAAASLLLSSLTKED